jgi:predicted  nucleic acid-binding Zn-ribbon protein
LNVCDNCGTELQEDDLLNGCPHCGSKRFKFVNIKAIEEKKRREKEEKENPTPSEEELTIDEDSVETIKVQDKGIYEINLSRMSEGETGIYSDNKGNYAIDIHALSKKGKKEDKE